MMIRSEIKVPLSAVDNLSLRSPCFVYDMGHCFGHIKSTFIVTSILVVNNGVSVVIQTMSTTFRRHHMYTYQ